MLNDSSFKKHLFYIDESIKKRGKHNKILFEELKKYIKNHNGILI